MLWRAKREPVRVTREITIANKHGFHARPAAEFVRNVRGELRRVTWPNREQLQQSTLVVLIILLVLTAFVALWDLIFYYLAALVFT